MRFLLSALSITLLFQSARRSVADAGTSSSSSSQQKKSLKDLGYRVYPRRAPEEAAVLEWGNSAVISALDASVAHFGPQTSQAALLEVEAMPVLASPINGVPSNVEDSESLIRPLDNADEVHGNVVVMTNQGNKLTDVQMAQIAQESGAAALLVVNVDDDRPEDIYRLAANDSETEAAEKILIPVVMISLNSANVLTTATVTPDMKRKDIVNNGMPDRVRLYAGGDRPFFEDVEAMSPTVYLIHNLLTEQECDALVRQAETRVSPVLTRDSLQLSPHPEHYPGVERVMLWQGLVQSPARKQIEERIEQVTGFPSSHFSDFVVDRFTKSSGAHWKPHYDTFEEGSDEHYTVPMASITIFLTEVSSGGEVVYPSTAGSSTSHSQPLKIQPKRGLAVVHHNTDDRHQFDTNSLHALLPLSSDDDRPLYVARKYIYSKPISNARRMALPLYAMPFGGKLPRVLVSLHDWMIQTAGDDGGWMFDKLCVFVPMLLMLLLVQMIVTYIMKQANSTKATEKKEESSSLSAKRSKRKKA